MQPYEGVHRRLQFCQRSHLTEFAIEQLEQSARVISHVSTHRLAQTAIKRLPVLTGVYVVRAVANLKRLTLSQGAAEVWQYYRGDRDLTKPQTIYVGCFKQVVGNSSRHWLLLAATSDQIKLLACTGGHACPQEHQLLHTTNAHERAFSPVQGRQPNEFV